MADANAAPRRRLPSDATGQRADTEELVHTLQTEFKGKTAGDIRRAIARARQAGGERGARNRILEQARVLLGAGSRS